MLFIAFYFAYFQEEKPMYVSDVQAGLLDLKWNVYLNFKTYCLRNLLENAFQ